MGTNFLDRAGLVAFLEGCKSIFANKTGADHTHQSTQISDLIDVIYPVGSIYSSTSATSPAELFGCGTWEQITGRFLFAADDTYTAGTTGGEAEHVLTIDEMPSHNHMLKTDIDNDAYNITWSEWFEYTDGWTQEAGETEAPATHTTKTGGGQPHNNMPPFLAIYVWERIS